MKEDDSNILDKLKSDDESALRYLFNAYFQELYRYTCKITNCGEASEEIIQDVYLNLWNTRRTLNIESSFKAYLMGAVRNRSINYLKRKYVKLETESEGLTISATQGSDSDLVTAELDQIVQEGLSKLPEKTRLIFSLSRGSDLKHQQIAEQLNLSKKAVEYHISGALRYLRIFLAQHGYQILLLYIIN